MKIGLLTFHYSDNYGALLQCFALQNNIQQLGYEVEVIDYQSQYKQKSYRIFRGSLKKSLKGNISAVLDIPFHYLKRRAFTRFRRKHLILSSQCFKAKKKLQDKNQWDKVVVGSDQVWNYKNTGYDHTYLLDFIKEQHRKIAYAGSFGTTKLTEADRRSYYLYLSQFQALSVREYSGQKLIKNLLNQEVSRVVDPTFLLDKKSWQQLAYTPKVKKPYILLYTLENGTDIKKAAIQLAQKLNAQVVVVGSRTLDFIGSFHRQVKLPGPLEFVGLINQAKWVLTDSYHGACLSLNLNKPFYIWPQTGSASNERTLDLLTHLHLEQRILWDKKLPDVLRKIDYSKTNKLMKEDQRASKLFLQKSLSEMYQNNERTIRL